jgi:hydrogenase/urease accessory protein HupE
VRFALTRIVPAIASAVLVCPALAAAHPNPISYLELRLDAGRVSGSLTVHDYDAARELGLADPQAVLDAGLLAARGPALSGLLGGRLQLLADGQPAAVTLGPPAALRNQRELRFPLTVQTARPPGRLAISGSLFPYDAQHLTFVTVYEGGALRHQGVFGGAQPPLTYYAGTWSGIGAVLATFVPAGIHHIVIGPDHILFLVGLLLLGGTAARLGLIATAFTLGHSLTLSLAVLGAVTPPAWIVEPAIALTVIVVGVDNLLVGREDGGAPRRDLRAPMAAVFGLIHGFGFASVLRAFGLPPAAVGWSLFGFNAGVEVGQLLLVVPMALALALLRRQRPVAARRIAMVGSVVVVLAGAFWFVQRVFFSEGLA